jgi:hypothetical protein
MSCLSKFPKSRRNGGYLILKLHTPEHTIMGFTETRTLAGAAAGALLLSLAVPTAARSQPVPRFAQPDVPSPTAGSRPLPYWTSRDVRSPTVEREHRRAQRIIDRICSGC